MWQRADEWTSFSRCQGDARYVTPPDQMSEDDVQDVIRGCFLCRVRPECVAQAVASEESGVWAASEWLPEISLDDTPRRAKQILEEAEEVRAVLEETYEAELARRGEF